MTVRVDKAVVVVFDGLRPDMVAGRMPVLEEFLSANLRFSNARSVFPSLTRVCTTSFATGAWPSLHGVVNNQFHLNGDLEGPLVDTSRIDRLVQLRERAGAIVTAQSIGERLAAHGRTMMAVHCGSAGSGLLINHAVVENGHRTFSIHGESATLTPEVALEILAACGPSPGQEPPKTDVVAYCADIARAVALARDQADLTVLWLPEPDTAYHYCGIHSQGAREAMAAADRAFAEILDAVASGPHAASTCVIAMSDHGQIATTKLVDLPALLRRAGFRAGARAGDETDVLITGGNMGELRPLERDCGLIAELGRFLMECDDVGMVIADPDVVAGALPLSAVRQTHARSAELLYVMRSDTRPGPGGLPGKGPYTGGVPLGGGMHGGLNPYETNTVLGVATPGGRCKESDDAPVSLIDLAPTIADLLGLGRLGEGRVLPLFGREADRAKVSVLEAASGAFRQHLVRADLAGRGYVIEGGRGEAPRIDARNPKETPWRRDAPTRSNI